MADCGTELRTALAAAPDGKPADETEIFIITSTGYFGLSFAQLWEILNELYAATDHNHELKQLEDVTGNAEDGQILIFDIETGEAVWTTPDWMPAGGNFDGRYVKISPENKSYTADSSYSIPDGRILEKIVVIPSTDLAGFSVGTALSQGDIMPALPIDANDAQLFELNIYANGAMNIWFNGITAQTTIKIYLR